MKNQLRKHVGTNFDAELSIFDEIGPSWTQEACRERQRSSESGARAAEMRSRAPKGGRRMIPDAYPTHTRCIPDAKLGGMRGVSGGGGEVNLPGVRTWSSVVPSTRRQGAADLIAPRIPPGQSRWILVDFAAK